ncbi:hypothetical protein ACV229_31695 [Burkholderia sp. MR1-5-21]
MKDAFERRALLLHLGDVLEAIERLSAGGEGERKTLHQLIAANEALASLPLLQQVSQQMTLHEFVQRASAAFSTWPRALLEPELNREHLASMVQRNLFAGNPAGWRAYVRGFKPEVAWFGDGLPAGDTDAESRADTYDAVEEDARADEPAVVGDVERDEASTMYERESVESGGPFYPSWPWKSST